MRAGTYFDIELSFVGRTTAAPVKARAKDEAEALEFVKIHQLHNSELFVACLGEGVDYGNLIIEFDDQGHADVHAHEHRGFVTKKISIAQALSALEYWLPFQKRTSNLHWLDE